MKTLFVAALAAVSLSGCASVLNTIPEADRAAVLKGAAEHIETCDRSYWVMPGGLASSVGLKIDCKAQPPVAPVITANTDVIGALIDQKMAEALARLQAPKK